MFKSNYHQLAILYNKLILPYNYTYKTIKLVSTKLSRVKAPDPIPCKVITKSGLSKSLSPLASIESVTLLLSPLSTSWIKLVKVSPLS